MNKNKIIVWTRPIRIFHLSLVILVISLFLTEDFELIHEIAGFGVLFLILFRIIYGLNTENEHEQLSGFFHSPKDIISFFMSVITFKEKRYLGHNPLAGIVMIALIIFMLVSVFTGSVGFAMKEEEGFLSFIIDSNFELGKTLLNIHQGASNIILTLIGFHLMGVLVSSILTKENLAKTIFKDGKKRRD